ncbi:MULTISPECIES: HlyD family secretion protein [Shewanella]|uniref:HlyD-like secretion protein n=1 Tax=Shewanella japonica TaxID=93973 RepID=A0ABM6JLE0_9GAMM|nr:MULTISPECIES: efflux RND transporter periplasmic adaptor subunit [Shewanella]ARD22398.1 Putative HlyD-like secretion protein [Shewanella japonica]KPZ70677.1 Inner membrane protein YibH [Shewanella sp. P1-14-1]
MKEIMLPYVLIIWLLVKLGVIQWNLANAVRSVGLGFFIAFMLFTAHRFWSPADLTDSSTVKAPHAVLSPLFGQEIEEIFVTHNQMVKKGDLIYKLVSVDSEKEIRSLKAQKAAELAKKEALKLRMEALEVTLNNDKRNFVRVTDLRDYASEMTRDDLEAKIQSTEAEIASVVAELETHRAQLRAFDAQIGSAQWNDERREIRAQFDGQLSITNVAVGSRIGNMHLYDTSKKFLEMRIADQSYRYIKPGQFAEFYVDAFPGEIFRGRVHSVTSGTGESMISPLAGTQQVRQHVGNNAGSHGRTVVIEFEEPEGYSIPIGATGSGWISAEKPASFLGFMDIIGAATVRLKALKAYLSAL